MCLYPKLILNRKYTKTKKNGGNIPAVHDERVKYVPIGCQRCMECRKKKARDWQIRLLEEVKHGTNGKFITLTFSNESINKIICEHPKLKELSGYELDNEIATKAVRLWLERWRKKYGKSLRHWLVTELGHNGTENIHLHGIVWTDHPESIETTWQYGYVWTGNGKSKKNYVSGKTVNYIIKYITKVDLDHKYYISRILTSPGIGNQYTKTPNSKQNKFNNEKTIETYRTDTGHKVSLPIYYRNKIYSEEEREKLWLKKLDEGVRYINGEKIKAANVEEYLKTLTYYQEINNRLGYGSDEIDWDRKQYEEQKRRLLLETRIKKTKSTKPSASPPDGG